MSSKKNIAKNTGFLYIRMLLIMGITLYTSRVVLKELGVSDYGIYNLVAGFVTMLGFFNAAMSSATQRYLSFDIGLGNVERLKKTFSATLTIHIGIAGIAFIIAETLGLWYVNYKMVFPLERSHAVNIVYQFSILTFLLSIIQVPYNALIIARERMRMYAYVSILEAVLKLSIVFILVYIGSDKLITYAILTFLVALIIRLFYQIYCRREFMESKYRFQYDKSYYKELISYSGWNLFGNIAAVAKGQGVNMVLNLFLGTVINAAYGISNQVYAAVNMFVTNFQLAINPQIIKNYSQGNIKQTHILISQGSKFSFLLMLLIVTPILLNTEYILSLWLKNPPKQTLIFVQLCLINVLLDSLSGPLMIGAQAAGKIKWYQIIVGTMVFFNLPISYFILKVGGGPGSVYIVSIIISCLSLQFRLFFLNRVMDFSIKNYFKSVLSKVLILSFLGGLIVYAIKYYFLSTIDLQLFIFQTLLSIALLVISIVIFGITKKEKRLLISLIKNKIGNEL